MKELSSLRVPAFPICDDQEEISRLQGSTGTHAPMSRIALDETVLQLRKSRQRCDELRKRLEDLRAQSRAAPVASEDELRKQMEVKLGEERKTLRRMYSLMKKLSPSIHSECLLRVEEVCSRNSTFVLDQEALERLVPFSNEPSVGLIRSFVNYLFIVCLD